MKKISFVTLLGGVLLLSGACQNNDSSSTSKFGEQEQGAPSYPDNKSEPTLIEQSDSCTEEYCPVEQENQGNDSFETNDASGSVADPIPTNKSAASDYAPVEGGDWDMGTESTFSGIFEKGVNQEDGFTLAPQGN